MTKQPLPEKFQDPQKPMLPTPVETARAESSVPFPQEQDPEPVPDSEFPEIVRLRQEEKQEAAAEGKEGFGKTLMRGIGLLTPEGDAPKPNVINATNSAIRFAKEHQVDLSVVQGSGRNGKITLDDVSQVLTNQTIRNAVREE